MLTFGKVFRHRDKLYVFLAEIDSVIYSAKILDCQVSKTLEQAYNQQVVAKGISDREQLAWAFVMLTTEEWNNQACHYGNTTEYDGRFEEIFKELNSQDLENLKKEMLDSSHVPKSLKAYLQSL